MEQKFCSNVKVFTLMGGSWPFVQSSILLDHRVIRKAVSNLPLASLPLNTAFALSPARLILVLTISSSSNSPTCAVGSINLRLLPIDSESAFWIWAWPEWRLNWLGLSRLLRLFHSSLDGSSFRPLLHAAFNLEST